MKTTPFLCLFACLPLAAQQPLLIPRQILFGNPERTAPLISPDGKKIAYLAPVNGLRNVWVRTLGKSDDRVVTNDTKRGISIFFWQDDSEHVLYMQDTGGDENFHLYQSSITKPETKDLTPFEKVRVGLIAKSMNFPDAVLVEMNKRKPELMDVYRLDLKTGALTMEAENPGGIAGWIADNQFHVRGAQRMLPDSSFEFLHRADDKAEWKAFAKSGADESLASFIGFSADDKRTWIILSVGAEAARLVEIDPATGAQKVVAEDPRYEVTSVLTHPVKNTLEAVLFARAKNEWMFLDKSIEAEFRELQKIKPGAEVNIDSRDRSDRLWIVSVSAPDAPYRFYLYNRDTKKTEFLMAARPKLEQYTLAPTEPVSFPARDGLKLEGYLTMPPGVKKPAPTVLFVHGGPWARDTYSYSGFVQWLANRGYAVLQVNFRGSTGYGKKHLNAGDKQWGATMHDDLIDAKRWAIKMGYSDAKRFAIMGGSYGGYATLAGLTFTPEEFTCGVDIVGPSNLVTLIKSIPPYWAPIKAMFDKRMGSLEKEEDFLRARSPLFKADRITKPLLIAQGANDPRVKQAESDQIVKAMRDSKKPVTYIVFPDEGHGFQKPQNNLRFVAAAENFLAQHLGGRAEPPSAEHDWKPFLK